MLDYRNLFHRLVSTAIGLAICAAAAGIASRLFAQSAWRSWVPLIFVLVLVALAGIYGTAVGVLGSVLSALIFAYWLYAPRGLRVADAAARSSLAWMVVGGVALSYLLAPGFHNPNRHHK